MATPGLSFTQNADAPSAADTDNVQNIGGTGALVKTTGKGISPVGNIAMDPTQTAELLANMQEMVDQRTGAGSQFMRGLERASAWGSGGVQGPSQALAALNAQQQREDESVFGMRQQMAALKASNAQQEAFNKQRQAELYGGTGAGGTGGAELGTMGSLNSLAREALAAAKTPEEYNKMKARFAELLMNPDLRKPIETTEGENIVQVPLWKYGRDTIGSANTLTSDPVLQTFATVESGGKNIPSTNTKSTAYGIYQINNPTFDTAKTLNPALKDVTWEQFKANPEIQTKVAETIKQSNAKKLQDAGLPNSLLNQYATWFSGNTKLAAAPAETPIASIMTKEQIDANPSLAGKTAGQVKATMEAALNKAIPSAAAQTAPRNLSFSEVKAIEQGRIEQAKTNAAATADEQKTFRANIASAPGELQTAADMKAILTELGPDSKVLGQFLKPGMKSAIGQLLTSGVTTPIGAVALPGFSRAALATMPGITERELKLADEMESVSARLQTAVAQANKGQGTTSDAERVLFKQVGGSTLNSYEMLERVQKALEYKATFNRQAGNLMKDIQNQTGRTVDWVKFSSSPEYRELEDKYIDNLTSISKTIPMKPGQAGAQQQQAHPGAALVDKYLKAK